MFKKNQPDPVPIPALEDIHTVLIVGSGTMGTQIGLQCALSGCEVVLYDADPAALEVAMGRITGYLNEFAAQGAMDEARIAEAQRRITTHSDLAQAAQNADLVSESVPEDPAIKREVFSALNEACPPRTIFTTNTSTLVPSMFSKATGRPERFAALHFHQPVWSSNVVDVMPHPGTDPAVITLLAGFAERIGQIPIVLEQENYGYVFNAMLNALNGAALKLAADGITSIENIDRAWMGIMKMPVGPMGILDSVGLDTAYHITAYWAQTLNSPDMKKRAAFLKEYVDAGKLGLKSGEGFYTYPNPTYQQPGFVEGETGPKTDDSTP